MGCRSTALPRHSWVMGQAEALTASAHLAGANTRPSAALGGCSLGALLVKRALAILFGSTV